MMRNEDIEPLNKLRSWENSDGKYTQNNAISDHTNDGSNI